MQVTLSNDHLVVIDDYLDPTAFETLSTHVASRRYPVRLKFFNHNVRYALNSAIHLTPEGRRLVGAMAREAERCRVLTHLPAGDAADAVTRKFDDVEDLLQATVGRREEQWLAYTRGFFRSEAGAGLRWHLDDAVYSGAYVFYASPKWEADWGGELCVLPPVGRDLRELTPLQKLDVLDRGQCIFPRPNRLVLIRGGTPHRVSPVTAWARAPRYTVTGFFVNRNGLVQQEEELRQRYIDAPRVRRMAIDLGLRLVRS